MGQSSFCGGCLKSRSSCNSASMRRVGNFLNLRDKSAPSYTAVDSYEDDGDESGHDIEAPAGRELGVLKTPSKKNGSRNEDDLLLDLPPPPLGGPPSSQEMPAAPKTPTQQPDLTSHDDVLQESPIVLNTKERKVSVEKAQLGIN